jgi:hypothetical protein
VQGRETWKEDVFAARDAAAAAAPDAEDLAYQTQLLVRRLQQAAGDIKDDMRSADSATVPPLANVWRALRRGGDAMADVVALFYHPGRVKDESEAKRRRQRLMDRTLNEALQFAGACSVAGAPKPVIYLGDWAMQPGRAAKGFPLKEWVRALAKKAVVLVATEMRTTITCGWCGSEVVHPTQAAAGRGLEIYGAVYCAAKGCAGDGRLLPRDVHGAYNIAGLWAYQHLLGGESGTYGCLVRGRVGRWIWLVLRALLLGGCFG